MLQAGTDPEQVAVSADGTRLYVANEDAGTASVLDVETGEILATVEVGGEPEGVRASPDGRFVYVTADLTTRSRSSTRPRMRSSSNSKSVHGHGP